MVWFFSTNLSCSDLNKNPVPESLCTSSFHQHRLYLPCFHTRHRRLGTRTLNQCPPLPAALMSGTPMPLHRVVGLLPSNLQHHHPRNTDRVLFSHLPLAPPPCPPLRAHLRVLSALGGGFTPDITDHTNVFYFLHKLDHPQFRALQTDSGIPTQR